MADPVATTPAPAVAGEPNGGEAKPVATPEPSWRDSLPEKIRGEKTLTKFKDASALAESYINLEKHAGGAIKVPGENATEAEWNAFYEKAGVPKDTAGYGIDFKALKVPEGAIFDEAQFGHLLNWTRSQGFNKRQTNAIIDRYFQAEQARLDAKAQTSSTTAETALGEMRKEWGALTDRNVALVQRGVAEFGGTDFAQYLDESGLGNDPRFMKFAFKVFQPMMEDGLIKGENLGMKSADAKVEIEKLMKDPGWIKGDPSIIEKIRELTSLAHSA
jgi:hypothetical protein